MAHIVRLSEYRKAQANRRAAPEAATTSGPQAAQLAAPHYFCLRCDTDRFKLFPAGTVHCAQCGARMSNLSVRDSPAA